MSARQVRRWLSLTMAAAVVAALLVGCTGTADQPAEIEGGFATAEVELPDGRRVLCVVWRLSRAGGVDCDWNNARKGDK